MPILDIELIMGPNESCKHDLAQEIADMVGEVLDSPPGHTWVKLRLLQGSLYAENGSDHSELARPVFVTVLKARAPTRDEIKVEAERLSVSIAKATGRPKENVHILYLPEGVGRIAFGGKLVTA